MDGGPRVVDVYAYVGNDPLNATDPSGLLTFQLGGGVTGTLFGTNLYGEVGVAADIGWHSPQIGVYATGMVGKAVGADVGAVAVATITPTAEHISDLQGVCVAISAAGGAGYQGGGTFTVTRDITSPTPTPSFGGSFGYGVGASGAVGFTGTVVGCIINCPPGTNIVSSIANWLSGAPSTSSTNPLSGYAGPANPPKGPGK